MSPRNIQLPLTLIPSATLGAVVARKDPLLLPSAAWYEARAVGDGLEYRFPIGALAAARYLWLDMLLDGEESASFILTLREGQTGPEFGLGFGLLNQCSARLRMPLSAVDQNRWMYDREGAWLKPLCQRSRVDLAKVDRMAIAIHRMADGPIVWCMTPVSATSDEPPKLASPALPRGRILDELGQSRHRDWPGKSRSAAEVTARLHSQLELAPRQGWPAGFSAWGGWTARRLEATGFFRTHHDGQRWWLVAPDGCVFWSAGLDCVAAHVESSIAGLESAVDWAPDAETGYADARIAGGDRRAVNYLAANFIRAFGPAQWRDSWARITLGQLRGMGFNTVANWSDWRMAARAGFPYVRPLHWAGSRARMVFRDFPDVFDAAFEEDARQFAGQLAETAADPAMIGYFLMNEPTWGFASQTPAAGMLALAPPCATRSRFVDFLRRRYPSESALASAWPGASYASLAGEKWPGPLPPTDAAAADLAEFSTIMVDRLYRTLGEACRAVDPNHLNLGARYHIVPPAWAIAGMKCFDIFSVNCYADLPPADMMAAASRAVGRPILIGEWHHGALDAGLPASGIGRVRTQRDRGRAYRAYLEFVAAQPWCVGAHYFQYYDQSAIGRFDGENYNIGFLDTCNRPYDDLAAAARASHERMYPVAMGEAPPCDDRPEYLSRLFY